MQASAKTSVFSVIFSMLCRRDPLRRSDVHEQEWCLSNEQPNSTCIGATRPLRSRASPVAQANAPDRQCDSPYHGCSYRCYWQLFQLKMSRSNPTIATAHLVERNVRPNFGHAGHHFDPLLNGLIMPTVGVLTRYCVL